jgi:2-dehydropantoate 2-reductase
VFKTTEMRAVMKIAVIGAGAIGCAVGAALIEAGHAVTFCVRQSFSQLSIRKENNPARSFPAHVVLLEGEASSAAWALVCVKAHQVASASGWLRAAVGPHAKVAVLQNGVEQRENVEPLVPQGTPVVPVVVDLPAARKAPGEVVWHSRANLTVPSGADGAEFCSLFARSFVTASETDDLVTVAWRKLCLNAPDGAILTLTGKPRGVWHDPGIADLGRAILRECIAVGRAEGAKIDESLIEPQIAAFLASKPDEGNSMYADRMAGRETEWNARNAVIVRKAARHGLAVPVSAALVPLLAAQGFA